MHDFRRPLNHDEMLDEEDLRHLMADPRYWRDHDPQIVDLVQKGFRRLYDPAPDTVNDPDRASKRRRAEEGHAANLLGLTGPAHARDTVIAHLAPGEVVVPPWALTVRLRQALQEALGDDLPMYTVGSGQERRNPASGLPAFTPDVEEEDEESMIVKIVDSILSNASDALRETFNNIVQGRMAPSPRGDAARRLQHLKPAGQSVGQGFSMFPARLHAIWSSRTRFKSGNSDPSFLSARLLRRQRAIFSIQKASPHG